MAIRNEIKVPRKLGPLPLHLTGGWETRVYFREVAG